MSTDGHNHNHVAETSTDARYRKVLWIALWINAIMFFVEIAASVSAQSASLLADAIDFAGDAANYGLAIWALTLVARWRSRIAWLKGAAMLMFGLIVLGKAIWMMYSSVLPEAKIMGAIGVLALAANIGVVLLLYTYREGDANMQSVWLCTRNDAIGNAAVIVAAIMVWLTGHGAADIVVALLMAGLAMHAGIKVIRLAREELVLASVNK